MNRLRDGIVRKRRDSGNSDTPFVTGASPKLPHNSQLLTTIELVVSHAIAEPTAIGVSVRLPSIRPRAHRTRGQCRRPVLPCPHGRQRANAGRWFLEERTARRVVPWRVGSGSEYDVAPSDQDPFSFGPSEESDDQPSETVRPELDDTTPAGRFARGEPEAVAAAGALIGKVVRYRGYYIPFDERPDVIQETILELVRAVKGRGFVAEEDFNAFIRTVAYRRCVDWTRQATRRARVDPSLRKLIQPDDTLLVREKRELAAEIFSKLKEPCRELLALRVGRGLTYAQMALLLGRSEGALRTQSYSCLKQARVILNRLRRRQKLVRLADWRRR